MSLLKKILIGLASLITLLIIANFALSYWITQKLPSIIQSEKDFPYDISYEDLDIDLLGGNFTILNASLAPKNKPQDTLAKSGAFGTIEKIRVRQFNLWALLKNNRIKVNRIIIDNPDIILYSKEEKYTVEEDIVQPFKNTIFTEFIELNNGSFIMLDSLEKTKLKAKSINLEFKNIKIDSSTVEDNVPVKYSSYRFKCDSLFYQAGSQYHLTAAKINTTDTSLVIDNFKMVPELSRVQFARTISKEKDQYRISVENITTSGSSWGYFKDTLYVHVPKAILNKVNAVIYRPKMAADDLTTKKLYSQMLRELKFDLRVDSLKLKDSYVEYQEQLTYSREAAKVSFSNFNADVSNIYSPVNKSKFPVTTLKVNALFMKSAPLNIHWTFNVTDLSDSFTIKGRLQNIKSEIIDPVSKPLMNITINGDLEEIYFTFNGNRDISNGAFAIRYEDLKVEMYKKDGKKKNKLMSAVGNLLAKNDSKGELKEVHVSTERIKDKSVFNFLWKFLFEGLKKTILPKILSDKD